MLADPDRLVVGLFSLFAKSMTQHPAGINELVLPMVLSVLHRSEKVGVFRRSAR